jgi:S-adenosylmethionine:tRNA ribosyltransferase-isomerase
LLLEALGDGVWRALVQPAARLKAGERIELERGNLIAHMLERPARDDGEGLGEWRLRVLDPRTGAAASDDELERFGRMPLPPYIRRSRGDDPNREEDRASYQTMFARELGAVAAPTAGLHFTPELVARLDARGVERASVTLHVGEGTFRAVEVEDTREHRMHCERFELPRGTAEAIRRCRAQRGRVVAVGTTSARVLESCAIENGEVEPRGGETRLFITPPRRFEVVDALLTNFHLPRSTLLMLVSAFAGRERVLELYHEAIERGYRFYSYGDAMLLAGRRR